jgi:DNA-binding MarR family transcriptional regulator
MSIMPLDILIAHKVINLSEELSNSEKRVAAVLIDHFNRKTGQCDPGQESIAELAGICRRTVVRSVRRLARLGYIKKVTHGGHFHRNHYEPIWSAFRKIDAAWAARRKGRRFSRKASILSHLERPTSLIESDTGVHQTLPIIHSDETSHCGNNPTLDAQFTLKPSSSSSSRKVAPASPADPNPRLDRIGASAKAAQRDSAERRWNDALHNRFLDHPATFGRIVDAIDFGLSEATTASEMRQRGSGLPHLLNALAARELGVLQANAART